MNRKGWEINTTIIWAKTNPPFSGIDKRPNPCHEYIFQFYQGKKPHYNVSWLTNEDNNALIAPITYGKNGENGNKNLKSVWKFDNDVIETAVNNTAELDKVTAELKLRVRHPAMMNDLVASILIMSFTKVNDNVVDIFNGANTTGITCTQLGRNFTGFEVNKDLFHYGVERTKKVKYKRVNKGNQKSESKIAA
jgi:DNA modification methylase